MNPLGNIFVLMIFILSATADRKLHAEFNPGCLDSDNCIALSKLVYIHAEGDNDTLHFIFDFTRKPSLVILTTEKDAVIHINYIKDSITFTKNSSYTFASVFNSLYEFNDVNNTAQVQDGDNFIQMDLRRYHWALTQLKNNDNQSVEVVISANVFRAAGISKNGTVSITLKIDGTKNEGSEFPHLTHTPESGEFTLTLDHLETKFPKSRFAIELLTISSDPFNKSEELSVSTISDDKLSGGTFFNYLLDAKGDDVEEGGGFISWKPVVYKAANTHALNSSSTFQYGIHDHLKQTDWINTPLYKLYGNKLFNHSRSYLMKAMNVSFGQPNDGFYTKSNYIYWTFLVGVGAPPNSSLGFLEMSIIASILLMLTITMSLIFCIFMRWVSSKRNSIIYGQ